MRTRVNLFSILLKGITKVRLALSFKALLLLSCPFVLVEVAADRHIPLLANLLLLSLPSSISSPPLPVLYTSLPSFLRTTTTSRCPPHHPSYLLISLPLVQETRKHLYRRRTPRRILRTLYRRGPQSAGQDVCPQRKVGRRG
jgi:hypothetical protein